MKDERIASLTSSFSSQFFFFFFILFLTVSKPQFPRRLNIYGSSEIFSSYFSFDATSGRSRNVQKLDNCSFPAPRLLKFHEGIVFSSNLS